MKEKALIFGAGYDQVYGIKEVKKKYYTIGIDSNKNAVGKKYFDKFFSIDIDDKNKILKICKYYKVSKIFSFSTEYPIQIIGWLNEKLKLNGYNFKVAKKATDKFLFRQVLKKKKINHPKFFLIKKKRIKNFKLLSNKIKIIKPLIGSGSKGIFIEKNNNKIAERIKTYKSFYKSNALIEEYIKGDIYAIDGWFLDCKFTAACLTKKIRSINSLLVDKKIIVNFHSKIIEKKASLLAEECCNAVGVKYVPIHLEFIISKNKYYPIDFAIRGAGSQVYSKIISKIINYSTAKIQVQLQTKHKLYFFKRTKKIFYIYFFTSNKEGKFNKSLIIKKLSLIKEKYFIKFLKKSGEKIKKLDNASDRIGVIYFLFKNNLHFSSKLRMINKFFKKIDL